LNAISTRFFQEGVLSIDPVSGRPHNAWLDWLRFLAAFEVVLTHARTVGFVEYAKLDPGSQTVAVAIWTALSRLGHESVLIFFVLSGFLVGGRALELARSKQFSAGKYFVDRLVRIQIPLMGAIALTVIVFWSNPDAADAREILGNFFSLQGVFVPVLQGNDPLWTLSYEVWFYILGGATAFMVSHRGFRLVAMLLVLAGIFVFTRLNAVYLLPWVAGAIAYQWRPNKPSFGWLSLGTFVALAGVVTFQLTKSTTANPEGFAWGEPLSVVLIGLGIAVMLPHLYRLPARDGWFAKSGTWLASFSYSLYLIHVPVLTVVLPSDATKVTSATLANNALGVGCALLSAFLFSRIFETHGPKIKAWLHSFGRSSGTGGSEARAARGGAAAGE
jgi:peptidoglycan/LPS O-acetylase OafA/YrhL